MREQIVAYIKKDNKLSLKLTIFFYILFIEYILMTIFKRLGWYSNFIVMFGALTIRMRRHCFNY
jgi:hypothetical protein